jgi:SAM-dependent methyltransferase
VRSAYYENYWTPEGYNPRRDTTPPSLRRVFARHVDRDARCLDVGCGDGGTAGVWLKGHGAAYVGVDVAQRAVDLARDRGLDARKIEDAGALPFASAEFDVAVCIEVLEHLFAPDSAAAEIRRVLRTGGLLIATVPNMAFWRRRVDLLFGRWNPGGDDLDAARPWRSPHVRFFTRRHLGALLREAGFSKVAVSGITDAPFLAHVPVVNRMSRGTPTRAYLSVVERAPRFVSPGLLALAHA